MLLAGINSFVDLTNSKDLHRKLPYRKTLLQVSGEMGKRVEIENFPLPFRSDPTRSQKVNAFWMKALQYLICPPLSGEQARFVLNWKSER